MALINQMVAGLEVIAPICNSHPRAKVVRNAETSKRLIIFYALQNIFFKKIDISKKAPYNLHKKTTVNVAFRLQRTIFCLQR